MTNSLLKLLVILIVEPNMTKTLHKNYLGINADSKKNAKKKRKKPVQTIIIGAHYDSHPCLTCVTDLQIIFCFCFERTCVLLNHYFGWTKQKCGPTFK